MPLLGLWVFVDWQQGQGWKLVSGNPSLGSPPSDMLFYLSLAAAPTHNPQQAMCCIEKKKKKTKKEANIHGE